MIKFTTDPRQPTNWLLTTEIRLQASLDQVFAFFADAGNLEAITPPSLKFKIVTPQPIEMDAGSLIDYRLRLRGVPIRWRTEISAWDPPHRFVDRQLRGPYRLWEHTHYFSPVSDGTFVCDEVRYRALGGKLVHDLSIKPELRKIFAYRRQQLRNHFGELNEDSANDGSP